MKKLIEASHAVAISARMCRPAVIPVYPITPQTHIVERLSDFVNNGSMNAEMIHSESEHSALSSAIGAQATGVRTFTATASQGLALMHEILFVASGLRLPIVMAVANRALSAPINIWCFKKDANVLMEDLTYKPINKIKVGEKVLGKDQKGNIVFSRVKQIFKRSTDKLVNLKTSRFNITCTPEHEFYHHSSHNHWIEAKSLKNKRLHYFGYGYEINREFKRGWLSGISDGDGCFFKDKLNRFHFILKVKDKEIVDNFENWSKELGFDLRKVDYHGKRGFFSIILTKNKETLRFQEFLQKSKNFDFLRGYLAGIYDAEGSGPQKVKQAVIYNSNLSIVEFIVEALKDLNISFKVYSDKRRGGKYKKDNYHIKINNVPEFFIKCRPVLTRKRANIKRMNLKSVKSRIKIDEVSFVNKKEEVYNLETEHNTYIVNGMLVHNCDHQDSVSERDSGWIQIYVETAQEAFDTIMQAYRIAESKKILLPVMVCMDGYSLSHVYEEVDMPEQAAVDKFLPAYTPDIYLNPEKPVTIGPIAFPSTYMEFKLEQQKAMEISKAVIKKINSEFRNSFGRSYGDGLIEAFNMKGAEYAIIAMGSVCGTIKSMSDELKKRKTGLIRVRAFRPFPKDELVSACKDLKAVAVIDRNISLGQEGALLSEVKSLLFCEKKRPFVKGFIAGLGGREIKPEHIIKIAEKLKGKEEKTEWLL